MNTSSNKPTATHGRPRKATRDRLFWPRKGGSSESRRLSVNPLADTQIDIQFLRPENEVEASRRNSKKQHGIPASVQIFHPGQLVHCQYSVPGWEQLDAEDRLVNSVENSLLWQTEGRGDSDIGIHFFERRTLKTENFKDPKEFFGNYQFRAVCPNSPLSYEGQLVSILWKVRVRFFLKSGRCLTADRDFKVLQPSAG